jgi:hypothetical protein
VQSLSNYDRVQLLLQGYMACYRVQPYNEEGGAVLLKVQPCNSLMICVDIYGAE